MVVTFAHAIIIEWIIIRCYIQRVLLLNLLALLMVLVKKGFFLLLPES